MKHILIIVGEELHINQPFLNYILARYNAHFAQAPLIYHIGDGDSELPFKLENHTKNFDYITIVASGNNFYTISRILCTLTSDTLELKDGTLMPKSAECYKENSYIIEFENAQINLLKGTPTQKLPPFLLSKVEQTEFFYILGKDKESLETELSALGATYNINIFASSVLHNLVFVKAVSQKFGQIDSFLSELEINYKNQFIKGKNIVKFVADELSHKNLTLTFAESCTAGLCAAKMGEISGASNVFMGSLVTYSNAIKHIWLGVDEGIFASYGAVSKECAINMAKGALKMSGADFALAITGVAGPGGGTEKTPVGRVYIAVCSHSNERVIECTFSGDRDYIREQSALSAYVLLLETFWDEIVEF